MAREEKAGQSINIRPGSQEVELSFVDNLIMHVEVFF
jgi:hypothetical protein